MKINQILFQKKFWKQYENLIIGLELAQQSNFQYDKRNLQITFKISSKFIDFKDFKHKELKNILSITNWRMIIEQLIKSEQKLQKNEKNFQSKFIGYHDLKQSLMSILLFKIILLMVRSRYKINQNLIKKRSLKR
ncbi:unnamed protein product [Paramecium sonneborni]|uniref:Uncharacterized protein n=1 Tax=Paramecium sonneborni TaxID=65129 RepID=A0A8S1P0N8_9CILI|nr:unnamed protein product [Paramecium sonneborni]